MPGLAKNKASQFSGFTLIELLIVIAIIGILAVILFVLINPVEKQARSRDTGRISTVTQLGHNLQSYYTISSIFPAQASWAQDLLDTGDLSSFPSGVDYNAYGVTECSTSVQPASDPTYCYDLDTVGTNGAIVFARLEANTHNDKCISPEVAYTVFSTGDGRGGIICSNGDPSAWAAGSQTYVN